MGAFYNPDRGADWNYGGRKWRLSRSKIDLFMECPRCFWLDNKLGTKRPPGYPLNLNIAVDTLLKKEFDIHRKNKTPHPFMEEYGIDAVPFQHKDIDLWRDNFKGAEFLHEPTGLTVSGAIDDVWVSPDGELIIVDYKATSKNGDVNLDAEWQDGYKRQMEVYQWLFRQNGFKVSDTGYFVYVNGRTDVDQFDGKLEFEIKLLPYTGKDTWIEPVLREIKACLESNTIPAIGKECDYCPYREVAGKKLLKVHTGQVGAKKTEEKPITVRKAKEPNDTSEDVKTDSLF
ncbi:MAG: PD-(D/E)XK nuclease family protein [Candidatus Pacebacteria bacterium]|nr:PD-(D/E)XK nuclease family protein [Candidatus Paceibacterota bacterium]